LFQVKFFTTSAVALLLLSFQLAIAQSNGNATPNSATKSATPPKKTSVEVPAEKRKPVVVPSFQATGD